MGILSKGTDVQTVLYVYFSAAFTLMISVFHYKKFLRKHDDFRSFLQYFVCFFLMFLAFPVLIIVLVSGEPIRFLSSNGLTFGRSQKGLLWTVISIPAALVAAFIGSRDPVMKAHYPLSKQAFSNAKKFVFFEICYIVLYYLPWEFVYRGILFFPLIPAIGLVPALALQTLISTLYHVGHPNMEIFASLGAGFLLGFIAYATGSFLYTAFIHALAGVSHDVFLYVRRRPGSKV